MEKKVQIPDSKNFFTIYRKDDIKRPCVVIAPGGGYSYTSPRESECVALKFLENGFHAVVVNYCEDEVKNPSPMNTYAYAIDYLRKNNVAEKIIKNLIIALGFSAGGHVAGSVACHYKDLKQYNCKPNFLVLCYPVITTNPKYWHKGSFQNLLGEKIEDKSELKYASLEKNVSAKFPSTFIWSTLTDQSVPVQNSFLMVEALMKKKINVEFHMYPEGGHGLSLANEETANGDIEKINPYVGQWLALVVGWINHKINKEI